VGVYLGDTSLLIIYDRFNGINKEAFKLIRKTLKKDLELSSIDKTERVYFYDLNKTCIINVYKTNILDMIRNSPFDYLKLLKRNLIVMSTLQDGDLIALKRKVYYHTAIIVG
jgi:hypothetical protein